MHIINPYRYASGGFAPTDISGCVLWMDGSDLTTMYQDIAKTSQTTAGGNSVRVWIDKSASAHEFTEATTFPVYADNIKNSLGAVSFTAASTDFLSKATPGIFTGSTTMFAVWNEINNDQVGTVITSDGLVSTRQAIFADTRTSPRRCIAYPYTSLSHIDNTNDLAANLWHYTSAVISANTSAQAWLDGTSQGSTANVTAPTEGTVSIGRQNYPSGQSYMNGYIAEIIMYNSALSTANREAVESYLASKWAI